MDYSKRQEYYTLWRELKTQHGGFEEVFIPHVLTAQTYYDPDMGYVRRTIRAILKKKTGPTDKEILWQRIRKICYYMLLHKRKSKKKYPCTPPTTPPPPATPPPPTTLSPNPLYRFDSFTIDPYDPSVDPMLYGPRPTKSQIQYMAFHTGLENNPELCRRMIQLSHGDVEDAMKWLS